MMTISVEDARTAIDAVALVLLLLALAGLLVRSLGTAIWLIAGYVHAGKFVGSALALARR